MQEANKTIEWIDANLDPAHPRSDGKTASHFEATIRVLGGLLSAWHLSEGDPRLLGVAIEVGIRLLAAWGNNAGVLPWAEVSLAELYGERHSWASNVLLAEAGTLVLEFGYLAEVCPGLELPTSPHVLGGSTRHSGHRHAWSNMPPAPQAITAQVLVQVAGWPALAEPARAAFLALRNRQGPGRLEGLCSVSLSRPEEPDLPVVANPGTISWGGSGDSYYEYLLKKYLFEGFRDTASLQEYRDAGLMTREWLLAWTAPLSEGGVLYVAEADAARVSAAVRDKHTAEIAAAEAARQARGLRTMSGHAEGGLEEWDLKDRAHVVRGFEQWSLEGKSLEVRDRGRGLRDVEEVLGGLRGTLPQRPLDEDPQHSAGDFAQSDAATEERHTELGVGGSSTGVATVLHGSTGGGLTVAADEHASDTAYVGSGVELDVGDSGDDEDTASDVEDTANTEEDDAVVVDDEDISDDEDVLFSSPPTVRGADGNAAGDLSGSVTDAGPDDEAAQGSAEDTSGDADDLHGSDSSNGSGDDDDFLFHAKAARPTHPAAANSSTPNARTVPAKATLRPAAEIAAARRKKREEAKAAVVVDPWEWQEARMKESKPLQHARFEHLACFLPGLLALGHHHGIETGVCYPLEAPTCL